ncbi:MAG: hypothetical protein AAF645_07060, partial [Myxococcota bacterium]
MVGARRINQAEDPQTPGIEAATGDKAGEDRAKSDRFEELVLISHSVTAPAPNPTGYIPLFELAKGGMAKVEVVARVEGTFRRLFARKRPLPHLGEDPEFRNMFMNEARLAGSIRHPNVVPVLDVGEDAEGPYLVMEFIDGLPLSKLLRLVLRREEKVPIQIGLRVGRAVAHILEKEQA